MEEFLNNLYANTSAPVVSALVLGLLTAISPCPMATNITAIGFIGKDIGNRNRVFYNGLIYTLGQNLFLYCFGRHHTFLVQISLKFRACFNDTARRSLAPCF